MSAPLPIPSSSQREYWDETDDEYDESADEEEILDVEDEPSEHLQVADLLDFLDSLPASSPLRASPLRERDALVPLPLPPPVSPSLSPGRLARDGPLPPQTPQPRELDVIRPLPSPLSPSSPRPSQRPPPPPRGLSARDEWSDSESNSERSGDVHSGPLAMPPTPVDVNWRYSRCSICYEDITEPCILECGHFFCFSCLETFLRLSMNSGQQASLACPDLSCGRNLSDFDIRCILPSDEYYRFQSLKKAKYKKRGENEVWCPRLDCSGCAPLALGERWLTCGTCSHLFCMQCRGPAHPGLKCKKARKKLKKQKKKAPKGAAAPPCEEGAHQHLLLKEDRHTKRWASRHTKACPKCGEIIQKNGGCHHVACTTCGHEFCWRCMAPAANGPLHCKGKKVVAVVATVILSPVLVVGGVVAGGAYLIESRVIRPNEDRENCLTYKPLRDLSERASLQLYWLVD